MKCESCNGTGTIPLLTSAKPCEKCGGTGKLDMWIYGPVEYGPDVFGANNSDHHYSPSFWKTSKSIQADIESSIGSFADSKPPPQI